MSAHLVELHNIYTKELVELNERYIMEKDYLYNAMKEFVSIYEKESYIKVKIQQIERDMAIQFNQENDNDR